MKESKSKSLSEMIKKQTPIFNSSFDPKTIPSASTKFLNKKRKLLPLYDKEIKNNFMAKLEKKQIGNNNINIIGNDISTIFKGEELIFQKRKQKAINLIKEIKNKKLDSKENNIFIKETVKTALLYDNTNQKIIYESLNFLYDIDKNSTQFYDLLNQSKFCITKKINIDLDSNKNIEIDLINEFKLSKDMIKYENEKEIINEIIEVMNYLDKIYEGINELRSKGALDDEIKEILINKLIKLDSENSYTINEKIDKDKDKNEIYKNMFQFLFNYLFIKQLDYFQFNQPINYQDNSVLYLINIYYRLYQQLVITEYKDNDIYVILNEKKLIKFSKLKKYKENINLLFKNNKKINKEIDDKIDLFFFILEDGKFSDDLDKIVESIINTEEPLKVPEIQKFIKENEDKEKIYSIENNKLCLNFKNNKYEYEYKNYNKYLLVLLKNIESKSLLEGIKWNTLSLINYFDEKDIKYMKFVLKKILKSKLFKELWKNYSKVENITEYYFNEEDNINDLLQRIKFFPYEETDLEIQANTVGGSLKIITSGYYMSNIKSLKDYKSFKILELGRKIIILMHEICHFIKKALNILTNGMISKTTLDSEYEDKKIVEAGRYFEKIVFGWENPFETKKKAKSSKFKSKNKNNTKKYSKYLNIEKSLKLLNPSFYSKTLDEFKKEFYEKKNIKKDIINEFDKELLEYLNSIGFNLSHYFENKNEYKYYKINCLREGDTVYSIEYRSDNHNYINSKVFDKIDYFSNEK